MSDNRPNAYWEGDVAVFRASSLDTCDKALVALLMGYEPTRPPAFLKEAFAFGHEHEEAIVEQWLDQNPSWTLETQQEEVEYRIADNIIIRGHTDGRVRNTKTGQVRVLEVKTLGDDLLRAYYRGKLFTKLPSYMYQVAVYMAATDLPVQYVIMDKAMWKLNGEYHLVDELIFETAVDLDDLGSRLKKIVSLARNNILPTDCTNTRGLCPVSYLHEGKSGSSGNGQGQTDWTDEQADWTPEQADAFRQLCVDYREKKDQEALLKTELSHIRAEIAERMGDMEKVDVGSHTVSQVTQERSSIDSAALRKDGLYEKYEKKTTIHYPLVKEKKDV